VYGVIGLLPPSDEKAVVEKRFIILGYGRTGSTTFRKLLSQHPQVQAYGEVFRRGKGRRRLKPMASASRQAWTLSPF
jgi:hypothetical protein